MAALKVFTLWRTVTERQYKEVKLPADTHPDDVVEASWGTPWTTAKVIDTDGIDIEE